MESSRAVKEGCSTLFAQLARLAQRQMSDDGYSSPYTTDGVPLQRFAHGFVTVAVRGFARRASRQRALTGEANPWKPDGLTAAAPLGSVQGRFAPKRARRAAFAMKLLSKYTARFEPGVTMLPIERCPNCVIFY